MAAKKLRVRMYNVRFGDAILVTIPDRDPKTKRTKERNLLIDVGNVLSGKGGDDAVFKAVIEDILAVLDGKPLDLYVMTHEHLDHVQGLFHAATKLYPAGELQKRLGVRYAWLTASAAPDYYDRHPAAQKQKLALQDAWSQINANLALLPADEGAPFRTLLANNNPRSTAECVGFLRGLAPPNRTFYVARGFGTTGRHPFKEAKFKVLAPEEDTSSYYKGLLPMATPKAAADGARGPGKTAVPRLTPPAGVDAGAFQDLVDARGRGFADNLLTIDRAANNTSVVFSLDWRGHRLLFAGDAELRSWTTMAEQGVLEPVHFLKVSHHGSHNGTPAEEVLERFLPKAPGSKKPRHAVISTWGETYGGIPHPPTNSKLQARATLRTTLDDPEALYTDTLIG